VQWLPNCALHQPGAQLNISNPISNCGYLQMKKNVVLFFNLCVFFFQTATNLFGPKQLIHTTVTFFFWPNGTVKKLLRH
jgi:hypothetical protein